MGCYMSKPDTRVYLTEGKGQNFIYASATCQGWRSRQEDAEIIVPDFDDNASLFVLCDGHGGPDVARYTAEHLPNFIKNHPLYKEGNYKEALKKAFIEFDQHLRTEPVIKELAKYSDKKPKEADEAPKEEEEKGEKFIVQDLNQLQRIRVDEGSRSSSSSDELTTESSRSDCAEPGPGPSSSSAGPSSSSGRPSSSSKEDFDDDDDVDISTLRKEAQVPITEIYHKYSGDPASKGEQPEQPSSSSEPQSSNEAEAKHEGGQPKPSSSKASDDEPSPSSYSPETIKHSIIREVFKQYFTGGDENSDEDEDDDSEFQASETNSDDDDDDGDDESDVEETSKNRKKLKKKSRKSYDDEPLSSSSCDDDDSDDYDDDDDDEEEDEDEADAMDQCDEASKGDTKGNGDENEEEEEESEEDDDDDDDDSSSSDEDKDLTEEEYQKLLSGNFKLRSLSETVSKPGYDSGCTCVVTLIKDGKVYVANAGDSRCIMINRSGLCVPMTYDHKPELSEEMSRITKAGGTVRDGRINSGLNLSRALGDFVYKDDKLQPHQQMISPVPSIRVQDLNDDVEYMVLACDGIWNSLSNNQVTRFIRQIMPAVDYDLIQTSMQLLGRCIASTTECDGTGCDNMTAILVKFTDSTNGEKKETGQESREVEVGEKRARQGSSSDLKGSIPESSGDASGSSDLKVKLDTEPDSPTKKRHKRES